MRLEGSLDAFSLPDIFSLLSMTKKTGGLHLRRADQHGAVWLADGLLTGGSSDLRRLALGRRLAGSGLVSDEALAGAVSQVGQDGGEGIARVLRDAQAIDEAELHGLVTEHIADTVFDLMRWQDGVFEFVADEPNRDHIGVTREVDDVVAEARHRLEVWATIDPALATPSTVLSLTLEPDREPLLSRDEWALVARIGANRTVGELVAMSGRGEYGVVVALSALATRGLVRANDTQGVAAVLRRQELLASIETPAPVQPASPMPAEPLPAPAAPIAEPFAIPQPAVTGPTLVPTPAVDDDDGEWDVMPDDERYAEVAQLPQPVAAAREQTVLPQRPESLLPGREPDHPEPIAAAMGGAVMAGAAPATSPAGAIERDPSVNKSLLLRLIAGVRGL